MRGDTSADSLHPTDTPASQFIIYNQMNVIIIIGITGWMASFTGDRRDEREGCRLLGPPISDLWAVGCQ